MELHYLTYDQFFLLVDFALLCSLHIEDSCTTKSRNQWCWILFQIDVDIGSSSVARNVVGLVLGYITSIVVDLAVLIEVASHSIFYGVSLDLPIPTDNSLVCS